MGLRICIAWFYSIGIDEWLLVIAWDLKTCEGIIIEISEI